MPEIWQSWANLPDHADRAMVNALRSGRVPHRGDDGRGFDARPVPLKVAVPALRKILLGSDRAIVTYEKTILHGPLGPYRPQPHTVEATVDFFGPELAWDEFRDELIRFELPASFEMPAGEMANEPLRPLRGKELDDALDCWALDQWGESLEKLPGRDDLLRLAQQARPEFSRVTQQDIRALRRRLAPDEIKRGGARTHRRPP
jgi:hypothetical protein